MPGQLKIEFPARSAEFSEIDSNIDKRLTELRSRTKSIERGNKSALIFFPFTDEGKSESVERIAKQASYSKYIEGAAANVVNSRKNRSGAGGDLSREEFKKLNQSGKIKGELLVARIKANDRVRRIIAKNYQKTDIERLSDLDSDKQAMPARLRQADKSGTEYAPFDFTRDVIRPERVQDIKLLLEFARLLDKQQASSQSGELESYEDMLEAAINGAEKEDKSLNPDASRFIYELAKLWVANARVQHEIWKEALDRYNDEFSDDEHEPIDPYDPKYFEK